EGVVVRSFTRRPGGIVTITEPVPPGVSAVRTVALARVPLPPGEMIIPGGAHRRAGVLRRPSGRRGKLSGHLAPIACPHSGRPHRRSVRRRLAPSTARLLVQPGPGLHGSRPP